MPLQSRLIAWSSLVSECSILYCIGMKSMTMCALHRVFFLSTMVVWMFVTVYVLRTGTGTSATKKLTERQDSLKMMEELERQNLQLRDIAQKMKVIEMEQHQKISVKNEQRQELLKSIQQQLGECQNKNELLMSRVTTLVQQSARTLRKNDSNDQKSTDIRLRSTYSNIVELWYFLRSKINAMKSDPLPQNLIQDLNYLIEDIRARKSAALVEIELTQEFRSGEQEKEMKKLQELVQKRIHFLQNPEDCNKTRKLLCNLNKGCGFGCQLHHVAYCFLIAVGTQRTFVLDSEYWRYSREGWESVFLPLSETCTTASGYPVMWNGEQQTMDAQIVTLPIVDALQRRPPYLPLSIPTDLEPILKQYHGNPTAWWLGQIVSYLMRPQPDLQKAVTDFEGHIGFKHPIAGIHIRRTDKVGSEAAFHGVAEYMDHVADWYDKEDLKRQRLDQGKISPRLVYVASDDANVLVEAKRLYPEYKFLGDSEISKSAGMSTRYSRTSLIGVLTDIYLLSKCDYLVGTFSSQVTRVAYELMQTLHPDASSIAHSLDDIFYFGGQGAHSQVAIYDHEGRPGTEEISMKTGDVIGVAGNHWDGFSKGVNRRTNKVGLYPSYKVAEVITTAKFPTYHQADSIKFNETLGYAGV